MSLHPRTPGSAQDTGPALPDSVLPDSVLPHRALPDRRRPGLSPPAAALGRVFGDAALALTWRVLQARAHGPYTIATPPVAVERLYYTSDDGWQCPLFLLPARPGTSGITTSPFSHILFGCVLPERSASSAG